LNCESIRPRLADFIESNLDEKAAEQVREHVRACARCGAELAALAEVGTLLLEWRPPAPPAWIWANLAAELPAPRREPRLASASLRVAVAVAAGLLVFLIAWAVAVQPKLAERFMGRPAVNPQPSAAAFEGTPAPPPTGHRAPGAIVAPFEPEAQAEGLAVGEDATSPDPTASPGDESRAVPPFQTPTDTRTSKDEGLRPLVLDEGSPPRSP
jgi:hypothetical protein